MNLPQRALQRSTFLLILLILWEVLSRFGPWPRSLFPDPISVAKSFGSLLVSGKLAEASLRSLRRLTLGYLISAGIGVPLGIALARLTWFRDTVRPYVNGLQALPSICWLPLALLWFGLSEEAILFVVVMGSLLAIAISTEDAVNGIQPQLYRVAGTLGIKGPRFYFGVLIPAALPGIVTGLKLGWSFAWRALMAGELLFVAGGLGQLLTNGRELFDVPQVMAVMLAIVLIGVGIDRVLFRTVELKVRKRWGLLVTA
jgi:NitT/TauT family transport system permease protein